MAHEDWQADMPTDVAEQHDQYLAQTHTAANNPGDS
jgi:hypothetical protein